MPLINSIPVAIVETKTFTDDATSLLTAEEITDLQTALGYNPEIGARIRGTGGVRKLRISIGKRAKGKRGGGRVVYYYHSQDIPIVLLALYAKGEKGNLTPDEKIELRNVMEKFVACYKT
jgi:hypothetical protein